MTKESRMAKAPKRPRRWQRPNYLKYNLKHPDPTKKNKQLTRSTPKALGLDQFWVTPVTVTDYYYPKSKSTFTASVGIPVNQTMPFIVRADTPREKAIHEIIAMLKNFDPATSSELKYAERIYTLVEESLK